MTATIEQLRAVPLFAALRDRDLKHVLESGKEVRFEAGQTVVEEDRSGVGFHLILDGEAAVTVHGAELTTAGPGEYFGEMSVIDGQPRSATVTARSELTTFSIPGWSFNELLDRNPSMAKVLLVELSRRMRNLTNAATN
jgi:CRP/FNR family transcriptional regulator, cyclic AMP receptor protein